jgi:hypothetical protein
MPLLRSISETVNKKLTPDYREGAGHDEHLALFVEGNHLGVNLGRHTHKKKLSR